MSLAEADVHGNVPSSTLTLDGMIAWRTRSPCSSRYPSEADSNRIHTAESEDEKEIEEMKRNTPVPRSSGPVSATTMVCTREVRAIDNG